MKKGILALMVVLLLNGCSTSTNIEWPSRIKNETRTSAGISRQRLFVDSNKRNGRMQIQPSLLWSHYDATQRAGLYLVTQDDSGKAKINIISENPPDAALNSAISALANVKVGDKVNIGAKFEAIKSMSELGQRNAANYMVRDIAYRIESLKNSSGNIDTPTFNLYIELMKHAQSISEAESNKDAEIAKAKGEEAKALQDEAKARVVEAEVEKIKAQLEADRFKLASDTLTGKVKKPETKTDSKKDTADKSGKPDTKKTTSKDSKKDTKSKTK